MNNEETQESISIGIGDQSFRVRVAPRDRDRFLRVAETVNRGLQDVLNSGVLSTPRALAMTLFQYAVELEDAREALRSASSSRDERLKQIIDRIDDALDTHTG